MRAILIDPFAKSVCEVEYSGDLNHMYALLDCELVDCARADLLDIWVDDKGLLKNMEEQRFFWFRGMEQPLAGKALILSSGDDGESVATDADVDDITNKINWYTAEELLGLAV